MPTIRIVTPRQARASRAILGYSVREVAKRSGVSESSIRRIEAGPAGLDIRARLQHYYEAQGLRFSWGVDTQCVCFAVEGVVEVGR